MAKRGRPDPSFFDCPQNLWCHMRSDKSICTCLRDVMRLDHPGWTPDQDRAAAPEEGGAHGAD